MKEVVFVNVTGNQSSAINQVIEEMRRYKERFVGPMSKSKIELAKVLKDLEFLESVFELVKDNESEVVKNIEERISTLKKSEKDLKEFIEKMQKGVDHHEEYIKGVLSHIKEEVFEDKVVYTYDKEFFDVWLEFALMIYNFEIED